MAKSMTASRPSRQSNALDNATPRSYNILMINQLLNSIPRARRISGEEGTMDAQEAVIAHGTIISEQISRHGDVKVYTPITYHQENGAIQYTIGMGQRRWSHDETLVALAAEEVISYHFSVESDTADAVRDRLLQAGYHGFPRTKKEHDQGVAAMWGRIDAKLAAEKEAREGAQRHDTNPYESAIPTITQSQRWHSSNGQTYNAVRIKSTGFGMASDALGIDAAAAIKQNGGIIHYDAPAKSGGFVGTLSGGELREILYELEGSRWYLYSATTSMIDDWVEEWWVSPQRYTAQQAAQIIEDCRKMQRVAGN